MSAPLNLEGAIKESTLLNSLPTCGLSGASIILFGQLFLQFFDNHFFDNHFFDNHIWTFIFSTIFFGWMLWTWTHRKLFKAYLTQRALGSK
jgi:amino acid permease